MNFTKFSEPYSVRVRVERYARIDTVRPLLKHFSIDFIVKRSVVRRQHCTAAAVPDLRKKKNKIVIYTLDKNYTSTGSITNTTRGVEWLLPSCTALSANLEAHRNINQIPDKTVPKRDVFNFPITNVSCALYLSAMWQGWAS